jgi:hypothetical protein
LNRGSAKRVKSGTLIFPVRVDLVDTEPLIELLVAALIRGFLFLYWRQILCFGHWPRNIRSYE